MKKFNMGVKSSEFDADFKPVDNYTQKLQYQRKNFAVFSYDFEISLIFGSFNFVKKSNFCIMICFRPYMDQHNV